MDKWKEKAASQTTQFHASIAALGAFVLAAPRKGRFFLTVPVLFATSVSFVAIEFALLVLVGLLTAKLQCYILVNSFLKLLPLIP